MRSDFGKSGTEDVDSSTERYGMASTTLPALLKLAAKL